MGTPHAPSGSDRQVLRIDVTPPSGTTVLTFLGISIQRAVQDVLNGGQRMQDVDVTEVRDAAHPTFRIELPAEHAPRLQEVLAELRARGYGILGGEPAVTG